MVATLANRTWRRLYCGVLHDQNAHAVPNIATRAVADQMNFWIGRGSKTAEMKRKCPALRRGETLHFNYLGPPLPSSDSADRGRETC